MPRYNIQHPETKWWACFSTIVDSFITDFMPENKYQEWREREYGIHCGDLESSNIMTYYDAMKSMLCVHSTDKVKGFNLIDLPEFSSPCSYCKFWEDKCRIVERQNEIPLEEFIE